MHVTCRRWDIPNLQLHADDRSFSLCFQCPASVGRAAALKGQVPWGDFSHGVCESGRFLFYWQAMLVFAGGRLAALPSEPAFLGVLLQRSPSIYSSVFRAALAPLFWGAL